MDRYIHLALSHMDEEKWAGIANLNDPKNKAISDALDALVAVAKEDARKTAPLEKVYYGPTVKLLNLLSLAVFDALGLSADKDVACIFASNADHDPPGDMLNLRYRPDYHGFFGSHAELVLAVAEVIYDRMVCWPEIGIVGEQKRKRESGLAQLKSYVATGNRYRPDIPTFHGFVVHCGTVQLLQLSASGLWGSSPQDIGDIHVWIALVVLMYQSYEERDQKLVYNAQQTEFSRWDFTDAPIRANTLTDGTAGASNEPLVLVPFYAASAPGRVTFASYEVASRALSTEEAAQAFYEDEVRGFWKTSWQQKGRSSERDLLDRLHAGAWLPGLVRPYDDTAGERLVVPTGTDIIRRAHAEAVEREAAQGELRGVDADTPPAGGADPAADTVFSDAESGAESGYSSGCTLETGEDSEDTSDAQVDYGADVNEPTFSSGGPPSFIDRHQEILHLASVGEPLSQCGTLRELLWVIYDLLEVHLHMWDEGVLHRDVSWFNALCKPKHYIGGGINEKTRPCIRRILHCLGDESLSKTSNDVDLSPTALLTDLDHAIARDAQPLTTDPNGRERTGTPMFISFELSDFRALQYDGMSVMRWNQLEHWLTVVDGHAHGKEALQRAFPDDHGEFMAMFHEVRAEEAKRSVYAPLSERPVHKPRHDAESIYWVFLWSLARAQPRGSPPEAPGTRLTNLAKLADCLLEHQVGYENSRRDYLQSGNALQSLLHEDLAACEQLLMAMATYLAIPWHLYPTVNDNHVHVAFRRMIIGFLLSTAPDVLDRALNTERPRRLIPQPGKRTAERKTSPMSESLSSVGASGRANLLDKLPPLQRKIPVQDRGQNSGVGGTGGSPSLTQPGSGLSSAYAPANESLASGSSTGSTKRKAAAPAVQLPNKRSKTGPATSSKPRVVLSPDERARKATKYSHALHHPLRSAHALRLKVWNDRNRWFTTGG